MWTMESDPRGPVPRADALKSVRTVNKKISKVYEQIVLRSPPSMCGQPSARGIPGEGVTTCRDCAPWSRSRRWLPRVDSWRSSRRPRRRRRPAPRRGSPRPSTGAAIRPPAAGVTTRRNGGPRTRRRRAPPASGRTSAPVTAAPRRHQEEAATTRTGSPAPGTPPAASCGTPTGCTTSPSTTIPATTLLSAPGTGSRTPAAANRRPLRPPPARAASWSARRSSTRCSRAAIPSTRTPDSSPPSAPTRRSPRPAAPPSSARRRRPSWRTCTTRPADSSTSWSRTPRTTRTTATPANPTAAPPGRPPTTGGGRSS
jgi:hypothetical protein